MPIKYIGRTTTFKGKPLWEILANLKNFGVGRMVIRSRQQRYPEACYMQILKVAALPNSGTNPHESRNVAALVRRTFRGYTEPTPVQIEKASYKADYVLIPKDQEHLFLNRKEQPARRVMPRTTSFPPLLKEFLYYQAKQAGQPLTEEPKLNLIYNLDGIKFYRVADENETPTVEVNIIEKKTIYLDEESKSQS
ncbi:28S ribosomal protein S34, mitochondrial [Hylaeus volcanicus]|uniref:28S ribosomal protein S34, mitochondrial n=1 Tax=Hylaeus volcanicus TaxID=313075 RepID=UPI0023B7BC79|nr:28S ribosomal protein S34, mitochondrial [Hylaeus volcanicus]